MDLGAADGVLWERATMSDTTFMERLFVYSEPVVENHRFAVGLVPKEFFAEVREDYIEPVLVERFPLNLMHPESVVHLVREAPLARIVALRPTPEGVFVAVLPRRVGAAREEVEAVLRHAGFAPIDELRWQLEVGPVLSPEVTA